MALILLTGTILDPSGSFPDVSPQPFIRFIPNGWCVASDKDIIIPKFLDCVWQPADGTFQIAIESTTDAGPKRTYKVIANGRVDGIPVVMHIGDIEIPPTPSVQDIADLLS